MLESTPPEPRLFRWVDTLVVIVLGFFGSLIIGGILTILIYGVDVEEIDPAAQFWILLPAQVIVQIAAVAWVVRRRGTGSMAADLGFVVEPRDIAWVLVGPAALFGLGLVATAIRTILALPEENPQALLDTVSGFSGSITAFAIVIGIAVLGPLSEELTFRGLLLQTGIDKGLTPMKATIVSAALFSLVHLVDWSLASLTGAITLFILFLFGILLAQLRIRTGNLAASIFVHAGFNLTTILALFFYPDL